jgi:hypothetical protein
MAKRKMTTCINCGETGGTFRWTSKGYAHHKCSPRRGTRDAAKNLFEFTTMNISSDPTAGPVQVKSLAHIRKLEREHGVISVAANFDEKNWSDPPQQREVFRDRR